MRNKGIIISLLASLLLSGCLNLKTVVNLKSDNTGTVELAYQVDKIFMNMGRIDPNDPVYPIPVGKGDFEDTVNRIEGLTLNKWDKSEDDNYVNISAELSFDSLDSLNQLFTGSDEYRIEFSSGSPDRLDINFAKSNPEEFGEMANEVIENFFSDGTIDFQLNVPSDFIELTPNDVDHDDRSLHFQMKVKDILLSTEDISVTATW
ncbi:hypothetical protein [Spirochaeta cellobiosiphila]|uniref:hypothetical protein n=1 Tax=Spirochaeta cellobiosiphila TaxID=504483 RepID=UPI00048D57CC|nr:hypothetical protein [Spirochaeta cellobiosiphila]